MALVKTVAEVKEMLPNFVSNLSDDESLPNFSAFEYKYLVPVTGIALYNDIDNKYNNLPLTLTPVETSLLKKMRLVSVAYAYHDGLAMGHITLTDNGARKILPKDTAAVAKWEFEKLQKALIHTAYDATEVLLNFLFEKATDFNLWTASSEYKDFKSLLIRTGTEFSRHYSLYQPMMTFFNIRNVVSDAQELYIKEAIGQSLLTYILDKAAPDPTLFGIIYNVKKALAFFTIKRCCEQYNVQFSMEGFTVLSGEGNFDSADHSGRKGADPGPLEIKLKSAEKSGYDFIAKAKYALVKYYKATTGDVPDLQFKEAFGAGPLVTYQDPAEAESGNETRKGIYVMGK
jgi:hypothetical protein